MMRRARIRFVGYAGGGQSISLGMAVSASSSTVVSALKTKSIDQAAVADGAFSIASQSSQVVVIGLPINAETGLSVTRHKWRIIGVSQETVAGNSILRSKRYEMALPAAASTALPFQVSGALNIGLAQQWGTSQPLQITKSLSFGSSSEIVTAASMTSARRRQVGIVSALESARPISISKNLSIALAAGNELAFALSTPGLVSIGVAVDTAAAFTQLPVLGSGDVIAAPGTYRRSYSVRAAPAVRRRPSATNQTRRR